MRLRWTTAVALGVLLGLSIASAQAPKDKAPAKAVTQPATDFKALMKKTLDAWSTLDVDKVAPFYDSAAGHVYYDIAPLKYAGWKAYADGARKMFADYSSGKLTLNPDAETHQHGNNAWGAATSHVELTKKDGTKETFDARWTVVWEKRGEDWIIVHDHFSTPLPEPPPPPKPTKKK